MGVYPIELKQSFQSEEERRMIASSEAGQVVIRRLGEPGDLGWCVMAHAELYAEEFGWNAEFEGLVVRIVADYLDAGDRRGTAAWIAELDGERVGCVFCMADPDDPDAAKL